MELEHAPAVLHKLVFQFCWGDNIEITFKSLLCLFPRSQSLRLQRPQISRKLSAPAMLHSESKVAVELHPKSLEPPLEEKCRDSSENSEFEVIPDEVTQRLSEEPREKETSFTVKIFGEGNSLPSF